MRSRSGMAVAAVAVAASGAIALTSCGGSSKPGYCSDRSNLEESIKGIGNVNVVQSGGLKQLQSQLQKVQSSANALVSSAKKDFPSETSQISTSISSLQTTIKALPSSPTPQQIAAVAANA